MTKLITNIGLGLISQRIKGLLTEPLNIAWGTGTNPPTAADTALQTEDTSPGYARVPGVSSIATISVTNDTYTVSGTITAQATLQITEWGLFDTAGNLLLREVQQPGYNLTSGQGVNFVFQIQDVRA
jgi:hypothetical protein